MAQKQSAVSGAPPTAVTAAAPGPPRIRRAVALPLAGEALSGASSSVTGTATIANGTTAARTTGPAGHADPAEHGRIGARLFPMNARRQPAEPAAAAVEAPVPESLLGAAAAGSRPPSRTAHGTAAGGNRAGHRPLLVAAAVAGAVLASVPFVSGHNGRGGTTTYDSLGQSVPVASLSPDAHSPATPVTDGYASDMPIQDAAEGHAPAAVPQPQTEAPQLTTGQTDTGVSPVPSVPGSLPNAPMVGVAPVVPPQSRPPFAVPGAPDGPLVTPGVTPRKAPARPDHPGHGRDTPVFTAKPAVHAGPRFLADAGRHDAPAKDIPTAGPAKPEADLPAAPAGAHLVSAAVKRARPATYAKPTTTRTTATPTHATTRATPTHARTAAAPTPSTTSEAPSPKPAPEWSTVVVHSTYVLDPGQSVASNRMRLTMRTDGDLVITDEHGAVRWSSHTAGRGYKAVFQADGHFVVYTKDNQTAWSSGTAGNQGAELVIQNDGNVVILTADGRTVWAAGTQH